MSPYYKIRFYPTCVAKLPKPMLLQVIRKTLCRAERDLQVVAARVGVHIQHLACKVKALRLFALHSLGIYLPYRNSARRDDGMG